MVQKTKINAPHQKRWESISRRFLYKKSYRFLKQEKQKNYKKGNKQKAKINCDFEGFVNKNEQTQYN